jgi:hypothetical protein
MLIPRFIKICQHLNEGQTSSPSPPPHPSTFRKTSAKIFKTKETQETFILLNIISFSVCRPVHKYTTNGLVVRLQEAFLVVPPLERDPGSIFEFFASS